MQELLKEEKSLAQLAAEYGVHPTQLIKWRAIALQGLPTLFEGHGALFCHFSFVRLGGALTLLRQVRVYEMACSITGAATENTSELLASQEANDVSCVVATLE